MGWLSFRAILNFSPGATDSALLMTDEVDVSSPPPSKPKGSSGSPNWADAGCEMKMMLARQSNEVRNVFMVDELEILA